MRLIRSLLARLKKSKIGVFFTSDPRRTPVLMLLAGGALFIAVGLAGEAKTPAERNPTDAGTMTPVTYRETWTLPELTAAIEDGRVVAITAESRPVQIPGTSLETPVAAANPLVNNNPNQETYLTPSGTGPWLVATLKDGQQIPIDLVVTYATAFDVLRLQGYGRIMSEEALAARTNQVAFMAGGKDAVAQDATRPWWFGVANMVGLLLLMTGFLLLVIRMQSGSNSKQRGNFTTILPGIGKKKRALAGGVADAEGGEGEMPRSIVKMADVAGCDDAKLELSEAIEFLRSPERFSKLGATVPRGVMFYGPPGTGKTLLARAVAGEAEVPFTYASGSDFVEMFVGVGASRVRNLFAEAKKHGTGVIFIDEIDALAKKRGGVNSDSEREGTLNALLVEMDGFATNENLIVIGATNRLDTLDAAVLRPGRFTRKVHIGLPDRDARRAILDVHAKGKPLDPSVDLDAVARKTAGFSGAQLADLMNEAAIATARRGGKRINAEDMRAGWMKAAVGTSRRRSMNDRERSIIAAHEAGHAICGRVHGNIRRVEEISLYQHGEALGVTISSAEDNALPAEDDLRGMMVAMMGGRAAEELLFREITGGASSDFEQARDLAARMVRAWGLGHDPESGLKGVDLFGSDDMISGSLREARERAERAILDTALAQARETLLEQREVLNRVSAYLFEHERIDGDEFVRVFDGELMPSPGELGAWRDAASKPRDWNEIDEWAAANLRREGVEIATEEEEPVKAETSSIADYVDLPVELAKRLALLPLDLAKALVDLPIDAVREAIERAEDRKRSRS